MCSSTLMWVFAISLIVPDLPIIPMTCCEGTGNCSSLFCFTVFFVIMPKHRHSESTKVWMYETPFSSVLIVIDGEVISFRAIFTSASFIWVFCIADFNFLFPFLFLLVCFLFVSLLMPLGRGYFFFKLLTFITSGSWITGSGTLVVVVAMGVWVVGCCAG